ncbi:hypothetical protein KOAAANKH_00210 [Brevundimonas sp. NIBR10]|uniref:hypothetical protein n=1 Tax=Brevundimonas sp. NIBR10 TaxID=3015997 RepID=UPI0022F19D38|nr:hypothetical protein [Brevundimonas sp. NIBR10]WGM45348.1 hypothetical protein KOAAANKH_00210 [Brevundimonas sp. NIBR10]
MGSLIATTRAIHDHTRPTSGDRGCIWWRDMSQVDLDTNSHDSARMTSVDLSTAVGPFSEPCLLIEGKVNLIALDAIVERLGTRWGPRRDQIHDHVDRRIQRRLGSQGYHLRVSDTDILICQPDLGRYAGQAACLQILREILTHFIGEATQADDCVHQVTKVTTSEIQARRVESSEVERGALLEHEASKRAHPSPTLNRWTPFVSSDGRQLEVIGKLEPVFELKSFGRIGHRLTRQVVVTGADDTLTTAMVRRLSSSDILRIDLATAAIGMSSLRALPDGERQPSLIMPVSYTSLSSQRGRAEIARLLVEAKGLVSRGVICQIGDIEGVPQGALLQAVSLIQPYCLFVVAKLEHNPPTSDTLSQLKRSGVQALSIECPARVGDTACPIWMKRTIEAARRLVRSTLLYGLPSPVHAAVAADLGATHASLRE